MSNRQLMLEQLTPLGVERIELLSALGRVLAEDVAAPWDMPRYDHSAMDGFALRSADCAAPGGSLRIVGCVQAGGGPAGPVVPGSAVRIMTGAPVPADCDCVVPLEETRHSQDTVSILAPVRSGQHIRYQGEDVRAGEAFLREGALIEPPEIGMLAFFGKAGVQVYRRARVAILTSGDELVELGESPLSGRIINSNAFYLAAATRQIGAEPIILSIARDNKDSHREKILEGLKADALITTGGVSTGHWDLVPEVLAELGIRPVVRSSGVKGGGPKAFGMMGGIPVFSLPGKPVSTMMTFEEFVRPALLRLMGHRRVARPQLRAVLREAVTKKPGRIKYLRVRVELENGRYFAVTAGDQSTSMLRTMITANAVAVLSAERSEIAAGEEVDMHFIRGGL